MKKIGIVLAASILLTGCASQIQLTSEESNLVSEYAAYVLLKHDKHYYDAYLTEDLSSSQESSQLEEQSAEDSKPESSLSTAQQTVQTNQTETTADTAQQPVQAVDLATALGISDCSITYNGYDIMTSYPSKEQLSESNSYYAVKSSDQNHELLILKFTIANNTNDTVTCDIASLSPDFSIQINNSGNISLLSTLLTNDLSTFSESLPAASSKDVVLVLEISNDRAKEQIQNMSLQVDKNGTLSSVNLQ